MPWSQPRPGRPLSVPAAAAGRVASDLSATRSTRNEQRAPRGAGRAGPAAGAGCALRLQSACLFLASASRNRPRIPRSRVLPAGFLTGTRSDRATVGPAGRPLLPAPHGPAPPRPPRALSRSLLPPHTSAREPQGPPEAWRTLPRLGALVLGPRGPAAVSPASCAAVSPWPRGAERARLWAQRVPHREWGAGGGGLRGLPGAASLSIWGLGLHSC